MARSAMTTPRRFSRKSNPRHFLPMWLWCSTGWAASRINTPVVFLLSVVYATLPALSLLCKDTPSTGWKVKKEHHARSPFCLDSGLWSRVYPVSGAETLSPPAKPGEDTESALPYWPRGGTVLLGIGLFVYRRHRSARRSLPTSRKSTSASNPALYRNTA